jgi:hypothetical protein
MHACESGDGAVAPGGGTAAHGGGSPETSPATLEHDFPCTKLDGESTKTKRSA